MDAQVLHDVLQDGSCGNGPVDACLAAGCDDVRTFGCAVRCILVLEASFELCKPLLKTAVINDGPNEAFVLATMPSWAPILVEHPGVDEHVWKVHDVVVSS